MDRYPIHYDKLNVRQREAVDSIDGPLLVLAGPGTGKTELLSVRAAAIIRRTNARPENLLILTYTNSAARTMKERLSRVIGTPGYDVEVGTFHSFANSIIQESAEAANYAGDRIPMSDVDQVRAVEYALDNTDGVEDLRPFRSPYIYVREILRKIGDLKKDGISPSRLEAYLKDAGSACRGMEEKYLKRLKALSVVYRRYESLKDGSDVSAFDERGRYDFDDMIMFAVEALSKEGTLLEEYRDRYRHVMVDEFQDTNGAQMDLLFALMDGAHPNLCAVGDDDQSIYRFQGASVSNFRRLRERFPGLKVVKLDRSYRSGPDLISVSRKIIGSIPADERVEEKDLVNARDVPGGEIAYHEFTTEAEELLFVVDRVRSLARKISTSPGASQEERADPYSGIAVLVRKRDQILKVVDAFLQAGIPYATDGKEDIEGEKRVRQLIDVLELAHTDPKDCEAKDLALYKVLVADYLGIRLEDIFRLIERLNRKKGSEDPQATLTGELLSMEGAPGKAPQPFARAAGAIRALLEDSDSVPVHKLIMDFIKSAGLLEHMLREYSGRELVKIRQLRATGSFVNMIKEADISTPGIRLGEFLDELHRRKVHGLPIQGKLVTLTQRGVRIYTAHGAKGLEFHSVIMPFCLQNRSWPLKPVAERIRLPYDLLPEREAPRAHRTASDLALQDETRLFYVASTRAKSDLIFTASPGEDAVAASYIDKLGMAKAASPDRPVEEGELIARSISASGSADDLSGAKEVLADMVRNMTLNPTRLNNYLACPRRFLYNDVLKLPGPKKRSLVFGNCVHKALEEVFKAYVETGKFPRFPKFEREFVRELGFQGVDSAMERECRTRMKSVKGWFDHAREGVKVPIGLEKKLMVTVGDNIIFTGKYDRVEWDDEAKATVRILDYKTGKPDDHIKAIGRSHDLKSPDCEPYLRQLVAYKLLFERDKVRSGGRSVSAGALVFIEPVQSDIAKLGYSRGDFVTLSVPVTAAMVSDLEDVIVDSWDRIKKLEFGKLERRDEKMCGNCDFDTICWG